ncbi:SDR family oxidoreductase [Streptomyces mayteni]
MTSSTTVSSSPSASIADVPAAGGPLAGRVAVVTGATSGIGVATARRLALAGASVALLGRRADRLVELSDELRPTAAGQVLPVAADLANPDALTEAAATVRSALGRVDLVVANAGAMLGAPFETADTAEWDRMIDVNLRGLLGTGRAFVDDLLAAAADGPADLVHIGSIAGHALYPNWSVYCATKAAVAQLTRNLRVELGPRGVRVHTVEPGVTHTELGDDMRDGEMRDALARMRTDLPPLSAEDLADSVTYAVSAPANVNIAEMVVVPVRFG